LLTSAPYMCGKQVKRLSSVHWKCVFACGMVGFVLNVPVALMDNWLVSEYETDGMVDAYWVCEPHTTANGSTYDSMCTIEPSADNPAHACPEGWRDLSTEEMCSVCGGCTVCMCMAEQDTIIRFHSINLANVGFWVIFEVGLLMFFCARYCVLVAWALNLRLVPLNPDRAFVADALIRAAFELGNPTSIVMGVDPHTEQHGTIRTAMAVILYKAKVVVHGTIHKLILGATTPPSFYMYAKPWAGTVLASIFWDALLGHCIMNQAELRAYGVSTVPTPANIPPDAGIGLVVIRCLNGAVMVT
jgi:hypothetical protein